MIEATLWTCLILACVLTPFLLAAWLDESVRPYLILRWRRWKKWCEIREVERRMAALDRRRRRA
jgi:hypothetical protein